jgi:hypothetical protein
MNRETYPAAQSPLQGDISAAPGATTVTVTGFQTIPAQAGTPPDDSPTGKWLYEVPPNVTVILNADATLSGGEFMSDDWMISANNISLENLVGWSHGFAFNVFVNGTGVTGS